MIDAVGMEAHGSPVARIAHHLGIENVYASDVVPERIARAAARGTHVIRSTDKDDVVQQIQDATAGRGADAVMEKVMQVVGVDRMAALNTAIEAVRRGGTISLSGVYGGATDPMPLMRMFDKQIELRMGQANVWRWVPDILPLLTDADPLGVDTFATHHVPLEQAPQAYETFRQKQDGAVKVLLQP